jgi:aminocarboxymuconate-semialdehyde decarboxylase
MIIDFHTHVLSPEKQKHPHWEGKSPQTIENVLLAQQKANIDISVISNPMHQLRHMDTAQQLAAVEEQNRYMASLQNKHDSIYAIAVTVAHGGDKFLREWERAITQDGLKGAWIPASLPGHYPDDDECLPFFQLAEQLDVPVVIHPPAVGFGEERMKDYRLASSIGRPADNTLSIARLIVRGIFEKCPNLKLVGSHLGGGICEVIGRMDYAYKLQDEAYFLGSYSPMLIKHPPSHYLKKMYLDTTCYHWPAALCALKTVGADHMVFGSDAPPLTVLKQEALQVVKDLELSAEDENKIYYENARKLLKI